MREFKNKNVQILSIEAKDLLTKNYCVDDKSLRKGSLDYSMETDELRNLSKTLIKEDKKKERYYTYGIINVTFKYKVPKEKHVYTGDVSEIIKTKEGEVSVPRFRINRRVRTDKYRYDREERDSNGNLLVGYLDARSVKDLRHKLYEDGFKITINGKEKEFSRYKRTSGSARVGKCLFIEKKYKKKMIDWSFAGIPHKEGQSMDCAGMEAYISLPTSSSIGRIKLKPENVLLIDDVESEFEDTVMATSFINEVRDEEGNIIDGDLSTGVAKKKIANKIFDGESLLEESVFLENGYEDKAILQLRNKMFKGIGIRTRIQQFFKDNNITDVSQLNGKTIAKKIEDIKLITTPSSVKYLKFGTFEDWLDNISETWAVCKYEKPQHHFNGMVQTHYQLLNTLGMSYAEMHEFLKPTLQYIKYLKEDVAVFKYHLGMNHFETEDDIEEREELRTNIDSRDSFIMGVLEINDDFINTKMGKKFRDNNIHSYIKNVRKGHVLVNGNYSVLVSCPYEYLLASISKYDGSSLLKPYECCCSHFEKGKELLGVRSPEPTMSNIVVVKNTTNEILDKYFYTQSEQIFFFSAIGWNILELLSSADMDGDQLLLTDNEILVKCAKRLQETVTIEGETIKRFLTSTDFTPKSSIKRRYCAEDLADTDIKCSSNKIGEIINLAQMLNSLYWDWKYKGKSEKELMELYKDISNLNILSCIEIDRAKKISPVGAKKELDKIREKYSLGEGEITRNKKKKTVKVRPKFFKYLDGGKDYKFEWFNTGMDYLQKIMDCENKYREGREKEIGLSSILLPLKTKDNDRRIVRKIFSLIDKYNDDKKFILTKDFDNKWEAILELKEELYEKIKRFNINEGVVKLLINRINNENLFEGYSSVGKMMLDFIYQANKENVLKNIKIKSNNNILLKDDKGNIDLYGEKYLKINKKLTT